MESHLERLTLNAQKLENSTKSVEDLPPEILERILNHVDVRSRQSYRSVAHRWKNIIDTTYKIKIQVHNANWDELSRSENVSCAVFRNWTRDFNPPQTDYTKHLATLEIWTPNTVITLYNMMPLLEACKNLKSLAFCNLVNARTLPGVSDVEIWKWQNSAKSWYPNLKQFKFIDNWETIESSCSFNYPCCSFKLEILTFVLKTFSTTKLEDMYISLKNSYFCFP